MRMAQYVSQKSVKDDDVYLLTDREQDQFIGEVAQAMEADMVARTKGAPTIGDAVFQVTGPHSDPIQGNIHVHTIMAWFDLDQMAADAPFRIEFLAAHSEAGTDEGTIQ